MLLSKQKYRYIDCLHLGTFKLNTSTRDGRFQFHSLDALWMENDKLSNHWQGTNLLSMIM